jgi:hypothetical protein
MAFVLVKWLTHSEVFAFGSDNWLAYILWQYVPTVIVVGVSILWELVDVTVRRLEPFYQMSRPNGANIQNSLSLDYITAFNYFVPFQMAKRRHWAVCLSSTVYLLSFGVLPVLTSIMWRIQWQDDGSGVVAVRMVFVAGSLLVSMAAAILGLALWLLLHRRATGLFGDPAGIGGIASLITGSNILTHMRLARSYDRQATIDELFNGCRIKLGYTEDRQNPYQIQLLSTGPLNPPVSVPFKQTRKEAHPVWLWARTTFLLGIVMIAPVVYIDITATGTVPVHLWALKPCYTLGTVISSALWQMWERDISMFEPYYQLTPRSKGRDYSGGTAWAVHFDFISCPSFSIIFHALRNHSRSYLTCYISLCSFLVQVAVIILPVAFENNMTYLEAVESSGDSGEEPNLGQLQIGASQAALYISYPIAIICFIGWLTMMARRRKPIMPRKPFTLSSTAMYLCNSSGLLEDFAGTSMMSKKEREKIVQMRARKYRFGWFKSGKSHEWYVGVEREDTVQQAYKFGETLPDIRA